MTLIEKPDNLSFSLNLNRFVVNSVEPFNFVLKKGADILMSQRYVSSENNHVEIDVKDIIHASLRYQLKESGEVYEQTELAADFTAIIDQTEVRFRVVRGGVAHLEDAATTFLKQNWLTWQPTEKKVTYYSPEFLTYYAVEDCAVKLKAYFSESDNETITYASLTGGKAYTLPMQYAVVAGKLNNRLPGAYDVWVESAAGERLTYVQRYRAEAAKSLQEDWVLFENSLGGLDCFRAYGEKSLEAKHTHNVAELDEETEEYRVDTERIYTKNTGYLRKDETKWLLDFFPSTGKYIFDGNVIRKITVTESSAKMTNQFDPCGYSFSYQFAEAVPLLNLARAKQPLEVLNIEIPEVGNFTLPPRLAEVGRLPLSEGVLFPVQNPYAENWGTTTMGAIAQVIGQLLGAAETGGGVGHQHKNIDLLNLLAMAGQYLTVGGKKIDAGYADEAGNLKDGEKKYIRKDQPDSTPYHVKFEDGITVDGRQAQLNKGAQFGESFTGGLAGTGGKIDGQGRGELRSLKLWEWLEVPELRYNSVKVWVGVDWQCAGAGVIESVVVDKDEKGLPLSTGTATLKLENGQHGAIAKDDIVMGIWHTGDSSIDAKATTDDSKGNFAFAGFATVYFRINTVSGANNNTFTYSLREGCNVHPQPQMHFACYGNFTDKERQQSTYRTPTYTRRLWKQDTWEIGVDNIAAQDGDLSNLNVHGLQMDGYSAYLNSVYFTGVIKQVKPDGTPIITANDRGAWQAGKYDYYDRVSHNGCLWLCVNEAGTEQEPSDASADWLKQVDKGESGESVSHLGDWHTELFVPLNGMVRMGGATWICKVKEGTLKPPVGTYVDAFGRRITLSNGGYLLTGNINSTEYNLVSSDGDNGKNGLNGCILRKSEWKADVEYRNDEALTEGTRYVDVCLVRDETTALGWKAYKCNITHTSTSDSKPIDDKGNAYWTPFGIESTAIFTSLIIAKDASIDFMQGNELLIKDEAGNVEVGITGGKGKTSGSTPIRIWAGGSVPAQAPFRVYKNGTVYATQIHISGDSTFAGKLEAASGTFTELTCSGKTGRRIIISHDFDGKGEPTILIENIMKHKVFELRCEDDGPFNFTTLELRAYNTETNEETNSCLLHSQGIIICQQVNRRVTISPSGITFSEPNNQFWKDTITYPYRRTVLSCTGGTYRTEIAIEVSLIMISGGTNNIYLPSPSENVGRCIYFKNTGGSAYIKSVSGGVRPPSDWAVKEQYAVGSTIAYAAVSDGGFWNIFFCG